MPKIKIANGYENAEFLVGARTIKLSETMPLEHAQRIANSHPNILTIEEDKAAPVAKPAQPLADATKTETSTPAKLN